MEAWYIFTLSLWKSFSNKDLKSQKSQELVESFFKSWFYWPKCFKDKSNIKNKDNYIIPNVFELFWINEWDNIYFFIDRKIYWVWKVLRKGDSIIRKDDKWNLWFYFDDLFWNDSYYNWVDMDELLFSDSNSYPMIRVMDWVSYIKLDIEENLRLRGFLLKNSKKITLKPNKNSQKTNNIFWENLVNNFYRDWKDKISNEKVIETWLLNLFVNNKSKFEKYFWNLDYLSSQIPASPQKPVDYMDKMDLFWYKLIDDKHILTKSKFVIIELKKGTLTSDDINQLLKYIDYVAKNYCWWNYSMINAYLIWSSFSQIKKIDKNKKDLLDTLSLIDNNRNYLPWRSNKSLSWNCKKELKILYYNYNWKELDFVNVN